MTLKRKNLLIFGHYGLPNWGDEAILAGIKRRIDASQWNIIVVSPFSEFITAEHKLPSVSPPPCGVKSFFGSILRKEYGKTRQAIKNAHFVIFGGGGLFQQNPKRALQIWSSYFEFCKSYRKKILIIGNSVGPFLSKRAMNSTAKLFRTAPFISVRDTRSFALLNEMKITDEKRVLATDAAFLLPGKRKDFAKRKGVLISLRNGDQTETELKAIKKFCTELQKKKKKVEFIPMQIPQSHDERVAEKLGIPVYTPFSFDDLRKKIASARFVLAGRLHAAILAMLSETPFLTIPSRPKISDFLKSADLGELVFSGKITPIKLMKKYEETQKKKKYVQQLIRKAVKGERGKSEFLFPDFI